MKLKEAHLIEDWLTRHAINNYEIIEEHDSYIVDVNGVVDLSDFQLTHIPVQFNLVKDDFRCSNNLLKSLLSNYKTL